jgi:hypothetical protein
MKRGIKYFKVITFLIACSITKANSQQGLQIGIEVTPQMSWIINNNDQTNTQFQYQNTLSGSFGITTQYNFTNTLGAGINVLYSSQGQRYRLNNIERIKKTEYVKVPLLLIYNYSLNNNTNLIGKIGPQYSIMMGAQLIDIEGNEILSNYSEAYQSYDIGFVLITGIGNKITEHIYLDASVRFDYGITDTENKNYKKNINDPLEVPITNGYSLGINSRSIANNMTGGISIGIRYLFRHGTMQELE